MSHALEACRILADGKDVSITDENYNSIKIFTSSTETVPPSFTYDEFMAKVKELDDALPMKRLREERDKKLAETDWWAMSDRTMTTEQTNYRQALRDIPANIEAGNLNAPTMNMNKRFADDTNIVFDWPEKPE